MNALMDRRRRAAHAANYRFWWGIALIAATLTACSTTAPLSPDTPLPPPLAPYDKIVAPPRPLRSRLPRIQHTIQAGVFSTAERAQNFVERLAVKNLDAYYFLDQDGFFKVRLERFESKQAARTRALELQALGVLDSFYIVQPQPVQPEIDQRVELQLNIVTTATQFIGTPYRWGGTSSQNGFDCSGLTLTVYRLNGMDLPRSSGEQFKIGDPVASDALEKGDLVFFTIGRSKRIDHVGIYSGEGQFIHAPGRGKRITVASLSEDYFKKRYQGARRYF
jgi:hypothetical protein